jgi:hypothetical protein
VPWRCGTVNFSADRAAASTDRGSAVNPEQRRGEYLRHHITHLSLYLREYADDSIEFEGSSSKFRTEENDDYEYTLTIAANDVPVMRAALGVGPGVEVYDTIVARAEEIVTAGSPPG